MKRVKITDTGIRINLSIPKLPHGSCQALSSFSSRARASGSYPPPPVTPGARKGWEQQPQLPVPSARLQEPDLKAGSEENSQGMPGSSCSQPEQLLLSGRDVGKDRECFPAGLGSRHIQHAPPAAPSPPSPTGCCHSQPAGISQSIPTFPLKLLCRGFLRMWRIPKLRLHPTLKPFIFPNPSLFEQWLPALDTGIFHPNLRGIFPHK